MNDDSVGRPSPKQIQDELDAQQQQMDEVLPEDQEVGDVDELEANVTGHEHEDLPSDMPLGKHTGYDHAIEEADQSDN